MNISLSFRRFSVLEKGPAYALYLLQVIIHKARFCSFSMLPIPIPHVRIPYCKYGKTKIHIWESDSVNRQIVFQCNHNIQSSGYLVVWYLFNVRIPVHVFVNDQPQEVQFNNPLYWLWISNNIRNYITIVPLTVMEEHVFSDSLSMFKILNVCWNHDKGLKYKDP